MRIIKFGSITFREGQAPNVHDWVVEREDADPANATLEQLLLGFAITWAQQQLTRATNSAVLDVFRENAKKKATSGTQRDACTCAEAVTKDDPYHFRTVCTYAS